MGRFSQEREVPDFGGGGFGSMVKGVVSRLARMAGARSSVVEDDPRTWVGSSKCRELGTSEFPVPPAVAEIFAQGQVDSIYFSSMGVFPGETRETYKWLIRNGDTVATATNTHVGARAFAMMGDVCQMQNIALVKKDDGSLVWLARDGRAYDESLLADERARMEARRREEDDVKRKAMVASVAAALKSPDTEEGLAAVGAKLRSKGGLESKSEGPQFKDPRPETRSRSAG